VDVVARIARRLFDDTAELHGLGLPERELLEHAARLHEIGGRISPARLHKHGAYLVENAGLRGFTPDEIAMMASVVRFHRGKDPRPVYPPFAALSDAERETVVLLVGVLRIAHAIGRGPEGDRLEIATGLPDGVVRVLVSGSGNPDAAVAEARSAAALLGRTLGGPIEIGVGIVGRR
jgi:exopolyphosphatase/guanosine-5'-triphosphate,3'-diphosphate pyrophosphatase